MEILNCCVCCCRRFRKTCQSSCSLLQFLFCPDTSESLAVASHWLEVRNTPELIELISRTSLRRFISTRCISLCRILQLDSI